MNENAVLILDQYELEVVRTYTGRGVIMLETREGTKMVTEFTGSRTILPYEQQLMDRLSKVGFCGTDRIVPNREGELLSKDSDNIYYIVKDCPGGKACDTKNTEELCRAMGLLAGFHKLARGLWEIPGDETSGRFYGASVAEEYEKHNRELKKVQRFIRGRQKKGDFELLFLKYAPCFLEQSSHAARLLEESAYGELYGEACGQGRICHGEFIHHNVIFDRKEAAILHFDRCCVDVQIHDLYLFFRKIMEKHNWNAELGGRLLASYERVLPLNKRERQYLGLRLYYPEKVWKLANHYFHTNKAWIPEKSQEKLEIFLAQEDNRIKCLKMLFAP